MSITLVFTSLIFVMTMLVIFWRPKGINEAVPAGVGAGLILLTGIVSQADISDIVAKLVGLRLRL